MKECTDCKKTKEFSEFYKQKKNSRKLGEYIYYPPYCKECAIVRGQNYQKENKEWRVEYDKKIYREKEGYYKDKAIKWNSENTDVKRVNFKKWQNENKDKLREYREKRQLHKNHDISKEELALIYKYSGSSCMYCGMTEEESLAKFKERLHKDHAINEGSNGIDNCVLACKSCNSSKHDKDWNEWFVTSQHYTEEKYEVIEQWLGIWEQSDDAFI